MGVADCRRGVVFDCVGDCTFGRVYWQLVCDLVEQRAKIDVAKTLAAAAVPAVPTPLRFLLPLPPRPLRAATVASAPLPRAFLESQRPGMAGRFPRGAMPSFPRVRGYGYRGSRRRPRRNRGRARRCRRPPPLRPPLLKSAWRLVWRPMCDWGRGAVGRAARAGAVLWRWWRWCGGCLFGRRLSCRVQLRAAGVP